MHAAERVQPICVSERGEGGTLLPTRRLPSERSLRKKENSETSMEKIKEKNADQADCWRIWWTEMVNGEFVAN